MLGGFAVRGLAALGLIAPMLRPLSAGGQECDPCAITLSRVVELSSDVAAFVPSFTVSVARFADGRYVVSPLFVEPTLLLYSADGALLSLYDRRGSGPRELEAGRGPVLFLGRADTLYAFDRSRLLRLDSDLSYLDTRRVSIPVRRSAVVLEKGRLLVDGRVRAADPTTVFAANILRADGSILRSLEPTDDAARTSLLAATSDGFLAMHSNDSEVRRYSLAGEMEHAVTVDRAWFEPWSGAVPGESLTVPPRPYNASVSEFSRSLLLVVTWVADREWQPATEGGPVAPRAMDPSVTWDSVVELVDARNGEVLASREHRQALARVEGTANELFSVREGPDGHVVVEVWRVEAAAGGLPSADDARSNGGTR